MISMLTRSALLVIALVVTMPGCVPARGRRNDAQPSVRVPAGIVSPPAGLLPGTNYRGLWLGSNQDYSCCWTAGSATLDATKSWPSHTMVVGFYVADPPKPEDPEEDAAQLREWRFYHTHLFDANVTLNRVLYRYCCFGPGYHTVRVPLPKRYTDYIGALAFELKTTRTFVPARIGLNGDQRSLGLFVTRVFFEQTHFSEAHV